MKTYKIQLDDKVAADLDRAAAQDAREPSRWIVVQLLDLLYGQCRNFSKLTEEALAEYRAERARAPRINLKARDRAKLYERDGGKCRHCDGPILFNETWHIDHLIPLSKGGTNDLDNLALSCVRCNLEKSNKLLP